MATMPKQNKTKKHPKPAPFDLGASDLSVITKKLVRDRYKSIIKTHLKPYWIEHVKGSVRGRCEFSGTIREYFWCSDFIPQILEDAIYEILQQTAETCPKDNLRWYVKEAGILLQLGLVNRIYDYMVRIDQGMRSRGNLKSVKRVDVYDDKVPKMHKLVEQYVAAVSSKAVSPEETSGEAGEAEQRITLKDFIKKHCDLSEKPDIDSKCEMLMREHRKKSIKLPLVKHKYRRGQRKLYYLEKLIEKWPDYRMTLTTLPPFKKSSNK